MNRPMRLGKQILACGVALVRREGVRELLQVGQCHSDDSKGFFHTSVHDIARMRIIEILKERVWPPSLENTVAALRDREVQRMAIMCTDKGHFR